MVGGPKVSLEPDKMKGFFWRAHEFFLHEREVNGKVVVAQSWLTVWVFS
jgi:hypothetical protein